MVGFLIGKMVEWLNSLMVEYYMGEMVARLNSNPVVVRVLFSRGV